MKDAFEHLKPERRAIFERLDKATAEVFHLIEEITVEKELSEEEQAHLWGAAMFTLSRGTGMACAFSYILLCDRHSSEAESTANEFTKLIRDKLQQAWDEKQDKRRKT